VSIIKWTITEKALQSCGIREVKVQNTK